MSIKSINTSTTNYSGNAVTPSWINKHPVDRLLARTTRRQINLCNTNIRKKITLLVTHIRLSLSNKLGERRTAQKWELCALSTTFLMELTMWKKESVELCGIGKRFLKKNEFQKLEEMESRNEPVESPRPKSWRMTQPLLVPNKMTSLPAAMQVITPRPFAAYLSKRSTVNTCLPAWSIFQFNSLNSRFQFSPVLLKSKCASVDYAKKKCTPTLIHRRSIINQLSRKGNANGRKTKKKRRRFVFVKLFNMTCTARC